MIIDQSPILVKTATGREVTSDEVQSALRFMTPSAGYDHCLPFAPLDVSSGHRGIDSRCFDRMSGKLAGASTQGCRIE